MEVRLVCVEHFEAALRLRRAGRQGVPRNVPPPPPPVATSTAGTIEEEWPSIEDESEMDGNALRRVKPAAENEGLVAVEEVTTCRWRAVFVSTDRS